MHAVKATLYLIYYYVLHKKFGLVNLNGRITNASHTPSHANKQIIYFAIQKEQENRILRG